MFFTDLFIRRPVLATVVSLLIFLLGLRSIHALQVSEYPQTTNTVVTVVTSYPGASPNVMQGFITTPIQKNIAGADGIDYLTSESVQGLSTINAYIKLNFDPNTAFTDIMSKVQQTRNQLPKAAFDPVITKTTGSTVALMYIGFNSTTITPGAITDYLTRVVVPQLQTVSGLAKAEIIGGSVFAMRIWLNLKKMAAYHVSATEVANALAENNFQSAPGATKGQYVTYNISAKTDLHNAKQFQDMVVKNVNGTLIRLKDIATAELGAQSYDSSITFNGKKAVFIGITATPLANPLTVITGVRKLLPSIEKKFPPGLNAQVVYDATKYIRSSIVEVIKTIIEATVIVVVVIFLFLGSFRSVLIPIVTIPLSLVGVCSFMLALGYSINLLTLLAMVLAIGLVVDDAIVVVENIYRHIEEGMLPYDAAVKGAREIATPVIAMTITLAAVYAPIGFTTGLTGALFKEFAFTLACAVILSGVIALTLSPMMCSKVLNAGVSKQRMVIFIDRKFLQLKQLYQKRLHNILDYRPVIVILAVVVLLSCYFLYAGTTRELAPDEDQSALFVMGTAPEYANIDYTEKFSNQYNDIFKSLPEAQDYFVGVGRDGPNTVFAGVILKPWNERHRTQMQLNPIVQKDVRNIAGLNSVVFPLPALPVGDNSLPLQFVVMSTGDYKSLYEVAEKIKNIAQKSGLFMFIDNALKYNKPELEININRSKAAQLGINMQDIGNALAAAMGGNYINFFGLEGQSYQVIPQVLRDFRLNPKEIGLNYIATASGATVPLSTVISFTQTVQPNSLSQFQQLNAAKLQGLMLPGKTLGEGLKFLQEEADKLIAPGMSYDYAGQSRQFIQEGSALVYSFFFAIIVIFLVLAAQFESFRDPFIVLVSVPMSICGALIPLYLGLATMNIYTQIGLITLIGLISKHGILMVDFANKLQINAGLKKRDAIEQAAAIRLRPILMTTAAMIVGVVPLIFAVGAGAVSRFDIGLVIASGMAIGTVFTLFVVPTMYTFFAIDHSKDVLTEEKELRSLD